MLFFVLLHSSCCGHYTSNRTSFLPPNTLLWRCGCLSVCHVNVLCSFSVPTMNLIAQGDPHHWGCLLGIRYSHSCVTSSGEYVRTSVAKHVNDSWGSCCTLFIVVTKHCVDTSWLTTLYVAYRFRLIAKSFAAFLAAQMPSDASLRLSADAPGAITSSSSLASSPQHSSPPACSPSQQAQQTFSHLQSLRTNKQYASLRDTISMAIELVASPDMSLRDANIFLSQLVTALFPDIYYLEIVRRPSLWVA